MKIKKKLIDTNALLLLIVGIMDVRQIKRHKRLSIYDEQDFYDLFSLIQDIESLIVLPNVWTEVDNLLNNFQGDLKSKYIFQISELIKSSTEKYLKTIKVIEEYTFYDLGITDTLLLSYADKCEFLITSDSKLSDYAVSRGVKVYDLVQEKNKRLWL
ncbi:MAG: hypothetical protein EA341_11585 [Mongoliibacter sp.]|jgi:rRNA-processing protein FCF1|uniref:hypothetical protein n=1 Tax=Mongoliibacter sp. TaxID=2022438 RepID=UPI0012F13B02|nr:hypothetical protein [Mongoliibacter sp.]TVP48120.1 MAG: hypothetical protein EA341_11585 [Mongoliibacter sp.]